MRTVVVMVASQDGELLDSIMLEMPAGIRFVAVEPVNHPVDLNPKQEILDIGQP